MCAMDFYRTRAHAKLVGDDLVQLAGNHALHDLALALRQRVIAGLQFMRMGDRPRFQSDYAGLPGVPGDTLHCSMSATSGLKCS